MILCNTFITEHHRNIRGRPFCDYSWSTVKSKKRVRIRRPLEAHFELEFKGQNRNKYNLDMVYDDGESTDSILCVDTSECSVDFVALF